MKALGWLGAATGVAVAGMAGWLAVGVHSGRVQVPESWNPWALLHVRSEPNWLTGRKLERAKRDPALCRAVMEQQLVPAPARGGLGWQAREVPDRTTGPGCGFTDAWLIERSSLALGQAFTVACPTAIALAMWEQHSLRPAARQFMGSDLSSLSHLGSYACRNLYGQAGARRSLHATAQALDVAGFGFADGRQVSLRRHWEGHAERSAFIKAASAGACRWFDGVLGPDYNAAHEDHLHLEVGGGTFCPRAARALGPPQP